MSETTIRVDGLAKKYRLGSNQEPYKTVGETVTRFFTRSGIRQMLAKRHQPKETFWALRDVNFEVKRGDVVGIIGHNGAGKSTLLKILSRITEPTKGIADLFGSVGSLLEVGTGFHPELTGDPRIARFFVETVVDS